MSIVKKSDIVDWLKNAVEKKMIKELELDNARLKTELIKAYKLAEAAEECGLSNFLQDRIDIHSKHGWFLKSIGKA